MIRDSLLLCALVLAAIPGMDAFGHGTGYEILPPVWLGERTVSLEITSSQYENPDNPDREIQFSLLETKDGVPIKDVTYRVSAAKGQTFLFDETFRATDGVLVFILEGRDTDEITLAGERGGFFESLADPKKETVRVAGAPFKTGGLYKFAVEITTAESFSNRLNPAIEYDVGLSIPERTFFDIHDPHYGVQQVSVITYYDEIYDFGYDSESRAVSFSMPFEWSAENINQTSVVHEEMTLPKTFGDLLVSEYDIAVNESSMPPRAITIDDFEEGRRTVHVVLNQNDLYGIFENGGPGNVMRFELMPAAGSSASTVTENGQYRIRADWQPDGIRTDAEAVFSFDITDVFLKDKQVATDYELRLVHDTGVIAVKSGTSSDSGGDEFAVFIPEGTSGIAALQFSLGGNPLATASLPVVIDRAARDTIPDWVRDDARRWADGIIPDGEFAGGIKHLIKQRAVVAPAGSGGVLIPDWMRDSARWWADGIIPDGEFAGGIEYLVSRGIISV